MQQEKTLRCLTPLLLVCYSNDLGCLALLISRVIPGRKYRRHWKAAPRDFPVTTVHRFQNFRPDLKRFYSRLKIQPFWRFSKLYLRVPGNKLDLGHLRAVRRETHDQFCDENDLNSFLCSAKSGDQVLKAAQEIEWAGPKGYTARPAGRRLLGEN